MNALSLPTGIPQLGALGTFAAVAFAIIVIPGPSVMFVVSRALMLGRRAALVTVLGNSSGFFVQILAVAVGLGAIVERSIAVFTAIKLIGAAYLIWMGARAVLDRHRLSGELNLDGTEPTRSLFLDGFVVGVANPKTIVFFAAILPQFVVVDGASTLLQMVVLGLVFVTISLLSDGAWGLIAGTARQWFVRSPKRLEQLGAAGGIAIMGLGIRLALSSRES